MSDAVWRLARLAATIAAIVWGVLVAHAFAQTTATEVALFWDYCEAWQVDEFRLRWTHAPIGSYTPPPVIGLEVIPASSRSVTISRSRFDLTKRHYFTVTATTHVIAAGLESAPSNELCLAFDSGLACPPPAPVVDVPCPGGRLGKPVRIRVVP